MDNAPAGHDGRDGTSTVQTGHGNGWATARGHFHAKSKQRQTSQISDLAILASLCALTIARGQPVLPGCTLSVGREPQFGLVGRIHPWPLVSGGSPTRPSIIRRPLDSTAQAAHSHSLFSLLPTHRSQGSRAGRRRSSHGRGYMAPLEHVQRRRSAPLRPPRHDLLLPLHRRPVPSLPGPPSLANNTGLIPTVMEKDRLSVLAAIGLCHRGWICTASQLRRWTRFWTTEARCPQSLHTTPPTRSATRVPPSPRWKTLCSSLMRTITVTRKRVYRPPRRICVPSQTLSPWGLRVLKSDHGPEPHPPVSRKGILRLINPGTNRLRCASGVPTAGNRPY